MPALEDSEVDSQAPLYADMPSGSDGCDDDGMTHVLVDQQRSPPSSDSTIVTTQTHAPHTPHPSPTSMRHAKSRPLQLPVDEDDGNGHPSGRRGRKFGSRSARLLPFPLFSTESQPSAANEVAQANRRLSLSAMPPLDEDGVIVGPSATAAGRRSWALQLRDHALARLSPPNVGSIPTTAVFERTCFSMPSNPTFSSSSHEVNPVYLHVYDLSAGLLNKYSDLLMGTHIPGLYHSGVSCYGMEFYFEGGIGIAGSGRTRFGPKFKSILLGTTGKRLSEFLEWVEDRETTTHQIHHYHLINHNCHHFSDEAAAFLLDKENLVPSYVFDTIATAMGTPNGNAVREVLELTTRGTQCAIARQYYLGATERQAGLDMLLSAATACGVLVMPPTSTVLFRVENPSLCTKTFSLAEPYINALIEKGIFTSTASVVYRDLNRQIVTCADTLSHSRIKAYADVMSEVLLNNPLSLWGPPLNALRIAVLHKSILVAVVFHPKLLRLLMLGARDFPRLLPDGKVALLRLLCNIGCAIHGAVVHQDYRFAPTWVALVGAGLIDGNGVAVYTAACLANNLATSIVAATSPSLKRPLGNLGEAHPLIRLQTIILYNLRFPSCERLPEPVLNMLLLALVRIMSSTTYALQNAVDHPFCLQYTDLLRLVKTNESRALLCVLKTLEDLYR